jgi:hypothetical protein
MSIIINTDKDSSNYPNLKRKFHNFFLSQKCFIEYYLYNFQDNNEIIEITNNIFIGNYSTSTNKKILINNDITDILSIMPIFKPAFPKTFNYYHIKAYNDDNYDLTFDLLEANTFITDILNNHNNNKCNNKCNSNCKNNTICNNENEINKKNKKLFIYCEDGKSLSVLMCLSYLIFQKDKFRNEQKNKYLLDYSIVNKTSISLKEGDIIDYKRRQELYSNHKFTQLLNSNNNFFRISPDILYELLQIKEKKKKEIIIKEKHLFQLHNLFF